MLEIFLGELIITNKKFQNDKGSILEIHEIITGIFLKFSNILLLEKNNKFEIMQRASLISYDKKNKIIKFDKSNLFIKNKKELLLYLLHKYGENTCLSGLGSDEQIIIVKEIAGFIESALYYMTKYYPYRNKLFSNLKVLNPIHFSIDGWLDLKVSLPQVI